MDTHSVPFPSLTEMSSRKINSGQSHGRVNSSPSPPDLWLPQLGQQNSRARPHLRPLDLAASPTLSYKSSSSGSLSGSYSHTRHTAHAIFGSPHASSPRRGGALLTPPLTPSSSFTSSATSATTSERDGTLATPPEGGSPLKCQWSASALTQNGALASPSPGRTKVLKGRSLSGYFTPPSSQGERNDELSLDVDISDRPTLAELSARFGKIEMDDVTPRMEKTFNLDTLDLNCDVERDSTETDLSSGRDVALEDTLGPDDGAQTHFLFVRNVPADTPTHILRAAFDTASVKGILVRFLKRHDAIFIAYYDIREAERAKRMLNGTTLRLPTHNNQGAKTPVISVRGVSAAALQSLIGPSEFMEEMDGALVVQVENRVVLQGDMKKLLASFGDLVSFEPFAVDGSGVTQAFHVEYCDVRQRDGAYKQLNGRSVFGAHLRLSSIALNQGRTYSPRKLVKQDLLHFPTDADLSSPPRSPASLHAMPDSPSPVRRRDVDLAAEFRVRPRSVSASENMGCPDAVRRLRRGREGSLADNVSALAESPRSPGRLFFDAAEKMPMSPQTSDRQRSVSMGPEHALHCRDDIDTGYEMPMQTVPMYVSDHVPMYPVYPTGAYDYVHGGYAQAPWAYGANGSGSEYYGAPPSPSGRTAYLPEYIQPGSSSGRKMLHTRSRLHARGGYDNTEDLGLVNDGRLRSSSRGPSGSREPPSKNQLDLEAIESGMDTRTTVMIKNIPNKMSDHDLMVFIDKVCPRRIDFLYLRMDFQNGCNVGYAFVNFITVQNLLHFAKTQLGVKWNMYSSEKVLQMSYANYQGKEALVEKFKNSCIMDEREAWRPKIFYSDGPNQGLPEPFPAPTHLRRKERSASNRGALFVPGAHHHGHSHGYGHGYHHERGTNEGWRGYAPRFGL